MPTEVSHLTLRETADKFARGQEPPDAVRWFYKDGSVAVFSLTRRRGFFVVREVTGTSVEELLTPKRGGNHHE